MNTSKTEQNIVINSHVVHYNVLHVSVEPISWKRFCCRTISGWYTSIGMWYRLVTLVVTFAKCFKTIADGKNDFYHHCKVASILQRKRFVVFRKCFMLRLYNPSTFSHVSGIKQINSLKCLKLLLWVSSGLGALVTDHLQMSIFFYLHMAILDDVTVKHKLAIERDSSSLFAYCYVGIFLVHYLIYPLINSSFS